MYSALTPAVLITSVAASGWVLHCGAVRGAEFRVESKIAVTHTDAVRQPSSNLTLFTETRVYDFVFGTARRATAEITVWDPLQGSVTILNPQRQQQVRLSLQELDAMAFHLQETAPTTQGSDAKEANSAFRVDYQEAARQLLVQGSRISYRVSVQSESNAAIVERYHQFADLFARLNWVRYSRPPEARIELNAALKKFQLTPLQVDLTTFRDLSQKQVALQATSTHRLHSGLSKEDRQKIRDAERHLRTYQLLNFEDLYGN